MSDTNVKSGDLAVTLATWIYMLDDAGNRPEDPGIQAACDAIRTAGAEGDGDHDFDALGQILVDAVKDGLGGDDAAPSDVIAWVTRLFGSAHIATDFGGDRDERVHTARTYQFGYSLPWVARIIDRFPDGSVGPHWVMVERVTDVVTCMDPYPWDDLDEEYVAPVGDFMVKWELAGNTAIRWTRPD